MTSSRVLLPAPLAPRTAQCSPSPTDRLMRSSSAPPPASTHTSESFTAVLSGAARGGRSGSGESGKAADAVGGRTLGRDLDGPCDCMQYTAQMERILAAYRA